MADRLAPLVRAKERLDRLALYPRPVAIRRVRVLVLIFGQEVIPVFHGLGEHEGTVEHERDNTVEDEL